MQAAINKNVIIREAKKQDVPAILSLIKELAVYQNASKEVSIGVKELEMYGFGKKKIYGCLVAESTGKEKNKHNKNIIGIALYYWRFSTWKGKCIYLEDLIVTKSWRSKGVGKLLFDAMIRETKKEKSKLLIWQVLNWNKPAINFYSRYRATFDKTQINCKLVLK